MEQIYQCIACRSSIIIRLIIHSLFTSILSPIRLTEQNALCLIKEFIGGSQFGLFRIRKSLLYQYKSLFITSNFTFTKNCLLLLFLNYIFFIFYAKLLLILNLSKLVIFDSRNTCQITFYIGYHPRNSKFHITQSIHYCFICNYESIHSMSG